MHTAASPAKTQVKSPSYVLIKMSASFFGILGALVCTTVKRRHKSSSNLKMRSVKSKAKRSCMMCSGEVLEGHLVDFLPSVASATTLMQVVVFILFYFGGCHSSI